MDNNKQRLDTTGWSKEKIEAYEQNLSKLKLLEQMNIASAKLIDTWMQNVPDFVSNKETLKFNNISEAMEYYWDESRNPHGNYETDMALFDGERKFCEAHGYDWNEWNNKK